MARAILLTLLFATLTLPACTAEQGATSTTQVPVIVERTQSGIFFIRAAEIWDYNDIQFEGGVTQVGSCIRIVEDEPSESGNGLIIWPTTARATEQDGLIEITGVHGVDEIQIGDRITFNGNSYRQLPDEWRGLIPSECDKAPYIALGEARAVEDPELPRE